MCDAHPVTEGSSLERTVPAAATLEPGGTVIGDQQTGHIRKPGRVSRPRTAGECPEADDSAGRRMYSADERVLCGQSAQCIVITRGQVFR
jgi:hypothetical protein